MSCNGCRVLRKGCNEKCILRESLGCIDDPHAQSNATLFVAKFFGRADLINFISAVSQSQRPALFQSLLFEACGRTINPVNGAVGLLMTGNWHVCQSAVETVLRGGRLSPMPELFSGDPAPGTTATNSIDLFGLHDPNNPAGYMTCQGDVARDELNLSLSYGIPAAAACGRMKRRALTPSEESETTTLESGVGSNGTSQGPAEKKLLRLFE